MTLSRRDLKARLDAHGLRPSRALGQNFVADPNTVRRIARLAGVGPGDAVLEIGAGLGSLTLALLETGAEVTAVEVDRHLVPLLRETVEPAGARVIEADARTADWSTILAGRRGWSLVANLPYNVATPLVLDLLAGVPAIERMLVMVQRKVAERLAAGPGSKDYGIPSVKVAYHACAEVVGTVSPEVFLPRPQVESALVRIVRHATPPVSEPPESIFPLVETAFGQRRKMLRRSLAGLVPEAAFERAGVDPTARPEQLGLEAWAALAAAIGH